jgi:hypothetical protein
MSWSLYVTLKTPSLSYSNLPFKLGSLGIGNIWNFVAALACSKELSLPFLFMATASSCVRTFPLSSSDSMLPRGAPSAKQSPAV